MFSLLQAAGGKKIPQSQFIGVTWNKSRKQWRATLYLHGKQTALGGFKSERAAAERYDMEARKNGLAMNF